MIITPEKIVRDILDGLQSDSGIIMGIDPKARPVLEILMINAIKAWESVKVKAKKGISVDTTHD